VNDLRWVGGIPLTDQCCVRNVLLSNILPL